jgi:hypothetical protein
MSIARLKRLQRLEARVPKGRPWSDPFPALMRLWEAFAADRAATKAGRPFSWVPRPKAEPPSEESQAAFELAVRECDRMHERLTAERR